MIRVFVGVLCLLAVSVQSSKLFSLNDARGQVLLATLDPKTGKSTPFGTGATQDGTAQELSAIDAIRGVYYEIGYNFTTEKPNLLGLSTKTGNIVSDITLPFTEEGFVGVGQTLEVEPQSGHVIVGGRLGETGNHTIFRIDPKNGNHTELFSIGWVDVLDGATGYDPQQQEVYLTLADQSGHIGLFAISIKDGSRTLILETAGHSIDTLDFDSNTGKFYGWGMVSDPKTGNITRCVSVLDPQARTVGPLVDVGGYLNLMGDVAALDTDSGILYGMLLKDGANITDPFYLVGASIKDGSVQSSGLLGGSGVLPWSMEWEA